MKQLLLMATLCLATALFFGCVAQQPAATPTPIPTTVPTASPTPFGALGEQDVPALNESLDQEISNLTQQLG